MKDQNKHSFEDEWLNAFNNASLEPDRKVWSGIDSHLANKEALKYKRRYQNTQRVAASILLLFLVGATAWFLQYKGISNNQELAVAITQSDDKPRKEKSNIEGSSSAISLSDKKEDNYKTNNTDNDINNNNNPINEKQEFNTSIETNSSLTQDFSLKPSGAKNEKQVINQHSISNNKEQQNEVVIASRNNDKNIEEREISFNSKNNNYSQNTNSSLSTINSSLYRIKRDIKQNKTNMKGAGFNGNLPSENYLSYQKDLITVDVNTNNGHDKIIISHNIDNPSKTNTNLPDIRQSIKEEQTISSLHELNTLSQSKKRHNNMLVLSPSDSLAKASLSINNNNLLLKEDSIKPLKKTNFKSSWVSMAFTPSSYNPNISDLKENHHNLARSSNYQIRDKVVEKSKPDFSYTISILAGKQISKHWSIESGMQYISYRSDITTNNYFEDSQTKYPVLNNILGSENFNEPSHNLSTNDPSNALQYKSQNDNTIIELDNEYNIVSIPVKVGYNLNPKKKLNLTLLSGLAADLFLGNTISSKNENVREVHLKRGKQETYRSVTAAGLVGLGINYHVSSKMTLMAEPTFRSSLQSIMKEDINLESRPNSFGLSFGLRYGL